ncbi:hypothetical protein [Loigolactobacillus bifermentans]|uniref:hypothetical protein n=1 Tax=Loigolactobacillus bifermentans TaxID=1607 RepID=UPI00071065EE|nr:hypothetical protein [Loigolactobacillus bifermentans]QGG59113.1 hypothetical protein LB003_00795 [Loigolactobacillus bifermentans]
MYLSNGSNSVQTYLPLGFIALMVIGIIISCVIWYRLERRREQAKQKLAKRDFVFFKANLYAQNLGQKDKSSSVR